MSQKGTNPSSSKKGNVTDKVPVKAAPSQSKNVDTTNVTKSTGNLSSQISRKDVETLAFNISKENKPYDSIVWLFTEAQLRVQKGKQPIDSEIKTLSQQIAAQKRPVKDLHWGLAENRLKFQQMQK